MTGEKSAAEPELSVVVVEDDPNLREALVALLTRDARRCEAAGNLAQARELLRKESFDAVLVDLTLPDGSGLDLLEDEEVLGNPEFIVVTGDGSAETAVDALKRGAFDYLTKPVDRPRLRSVLANLRRTRSLKHQVSGLREQLRELGCFGSMVGRSKPMQKVYELLERVAPTSASVFVTGESGTGKELVAQTVHALSARADKVFLAVNCGAMAPTLIESELFGHEKGSFTGAEKRREGFFERADGGTLFLDEITEMPLELQVKLLRVLEMGAVTRVGATEPTPVDVRVLAASNRDPSQAVADDKLREDLYYRLNVFPVELPPLRERDADIQLLAEHFLEKLNEREESSKRFTPEALEALVAMPWPGNVRELKNSIERAWILADEAIDLECLPAAPGQSRSGANEGTASAGESAVLKVRVGASLADVERRLILATLEENDGNKKRSAELLGVSLKTLYNRLNVYEARAEGEKS